MSARAQGRCPGTIAPRRGATIRSGGLRHRVQTMPMHNLGER